MIQQTTLEVKQDMSYFIPKQTNQQMSLGQQGYQGRSLRGVKFGGTFQGKSGRVPNMRVEGRKYCGGQIWCF